MATQFVQYPKNSSGSGGDASAANQLLEIAALNSIDGKITACNTGAVVVSSSALPSGAATEATLSTLNGKVTACNTGAVVVSGSALPTGAATEATLSTLNGKVTACNTGAVVVSSSALPSGAATGLKQDTGNTSLASIDTKAVQAALNYGAATGALRVASQIGNASAVADFAAGNSSAQTLRTVIATDQAALATKAPVNANGSQTRISNLTTVAQTLSVPANAVGFILQAEAANVDFVRWSIGSTASSTVGSQLQPGQDSGYVPCAANISVIANSGSSQAVNVQWVLSA